MRKGIIEISIVLGTITLIHGTLYLNGITGEYAFPMLALWVYALYHIISAIKHWRKGHVRYSQTGLLISMLVIFPTIKATWVYYNTFVHILVVLMGFVVLFYLQMEHRQKPIFVVFLIVNVLFISVSYKNMYNYFQRNTSRTLWKDLSRTDFKAELATDYVYDADIYSTIYVRLNYVYNYPPGLVVGYMRPLISGKKVELEMGDFLLKHEQGHFDLTKLYEKLAQDTVNTMWGCSSSDIQKVVNQRRNELNLQQDLYDSLTAHGTNRVQQMIWNEYFDDQLR